MLNAPRACKRYSRRLADELRYLSRNIAIRLNRFRPSTALFEAVFTEVSSAAYRAILTGRYDVLGRVFRPCFGSRAAREGV